MLRMILLRGEAMKISTLSFFYISWSKKNFDEQKKNRKNCSKNKATLEMGKNMEKIRKIGKKNGKGLKNGQKKLGKSLEKWAKNVATFQ